MVSWVTLAVHSGVSAPIATRNIKCVFCFVDLGLWSKQAAIVVGRTYVAVLCWHVLPSVLF